MSRKAKRIHSELINCQYLEDIRLLWYMAVSTLSQRDISKLYSDPKVYRMLINL